MAEQHEVYVLCLCESIEQCTTELYISDVRMAIREIERLREKVPHGQPAAGAG